MALLTLEGPTVHLGYAWSPDGEQWHAPLWGSAERLRLERLRVATDPPPGFRERLFVTQTLPRAESRVLEVVGVRDHAAYDLPWDRWSPGSVLAALCRGQTLDLELAEPALA
jgi:hypothetical protein